MKIESSPLTTAFLLSLESELRKLRTSQQAVRVDSGATVTLMTQRMELLDRMFDMMEKKAVCADHRNRIGKFIGRSRGKRRREIK